MKDFVNINFSEELIEQIVNSLDTEGYYCSEAALRLDTIKEFEIEIHRLLDLHGHRYFSLINLAKDNKSPFHILEKSRNFQSIKKEIIKRKLPSYGEDKENFNILSPLSNLLVVPGYFTIDCLPNGVKKLYQGKNQRYISDDIKNLLKLNIPVDNNIFIEGMNFLKLCDKRNKTNLLNEWPEFESFY